VSKKVSTAALLGSVWHCRMPTHLSSEKEKKGRGLLDFLYARHEKGEEEEEGKKGGEEQQEGGQEEEVQVVEEQQQQLQQKQPSAK